jgi:uncharacterized SAM-binding protein YcdF (DUF218 family)
MLYTVSFICNCILVLLNPAYFLIFYIAWHCCLPHRRPKRLAAFFILTLTLLSTNGVIASALIQPLQRSLKPVSTQQLSKHNYMIVLGGGLNQAPGRNPTLSPMSMTRVMEALRIYQTARKHHLHYHIFLTGGAVNHSPISEAVLMKRRLMMAGVPAFDISTETKSQNTFQNAEFLKPLLKAYAHRTGLLVTSTIHMPRAQQYFKHFEITTTPAPCDFLYPRLSWWPSTYNLMLQHLITHEYIGMLRIHIYNFLGLNKTTHASTAPAKAKKPIAL